MLIIMGNLNCFHKNHYPYNIENSEIQSDLNNFMTSKNTARTAIDEEGIMPKDNIAFYMNNSVKLVEKQLGTLTTRQIHEPLRFTDVTCTDVYKGNYYNGKFHGFGILIKNDGSKIEGNWDNGNLTGFSRIINSNGDYYQGEIRNGKPNGKGFLKTIQMTYDGNWINGEMTGLGMMTYIDGSKYEGEVKNGIRHGKGKFSWSNGDYYQGDIRENNLDGEGTYVWMDGRMYKGQFSNNLFTGLGLYRYKDGSVYEGEFFKNKRNGKGKMQYDLNRFYKGDWVNDKPNGIGTYIDNNRVSHGVWSYGKLIQQQGLRQLSSQIILEQSN